LRFVFPNENLAFLSSILDLSYVLELLKDLAASIELEKEPLRQIEDSKDLIE